MATKTEDKRTRRTVAAIKKAFWEIAEEKGIDKVTVSEIANRADINRKTFYHHFDSLDSLESEIYREHFEEAADSIKAAMIVEGDRLDVVRLFKAMSIQIAIAANNAAASYAHADLSRHVRYMEPIVTRIMSERFPELFVGLPERHLHYVVTFFCSGLVSSYRRWIEDDSELEMEELAEILSASLAAGISGIKEYARLKNEQARDKETER